MVGTPSVARRICVIMILSATCKAWKNPLNSVLTISQRSSGLNRIIPPLDSYLNIRGGQVLNEENINALTNNSPLRILAEILKSLSSFMKGARSDTLLLLSTTALNIPVCKQLGISPILGFLFNGILFGPKGANIISDIHKTELLAELGIVLFLFEMGIHLNIDTLKSMRKDVFGLGLGQFVVTTLVIAIIAHFLGMSSAAMIVVGGSLALSSSAFVLQLMKDKDQLGTQFGKSSFGVLLFQDLMVVPLLVIVPILAGSGGDISTILTTFCIRAFLALSIIILIGRFLLEPTFDFITTAKSQEAALGLILCTVLGSSLLTEGLGLSNTLGAFLAGVLLADSKYKQQIEKEISPFRGFLVGIFFFSVGFEINMKLIASKPFLILSIVSGIVFLKSALGILVCLASGLNFSTSQRVGLIISQGGEFAFVAFRLAKKHGIFDDDMLDLLLTSVSLTMVTTPFLDELASHFQIELQQKEAKKLQ